MQRTYLTRHFTLEELTRSQLASAFRLHNQPDRDALACLLMLACKLEEVRTLLGNEPIHIISAYRSESVNRAAGGVANSSHLYGLAADFVVPSFGSVFEVCKAIEASSIAFDQLIYEQGNTEWVHLGIGEKMCRQVLSWRIGKGSKEGIINL